MLEEHQAKQVSQSKIYAPKTGSYLESFKLKQEQLKQQRLQNEAAKANVSAPAKPTEDIPIEAKPASENE